MKTAIAIALFIFVAAIYCTARAEGRALPCSNPCVIQYSPGGVEDDFRAEGRALLKSHTPIIVDGPCVSSCTLLLDEAAPMVCITPRGLLGLHMGQPWGFLNAQFGKPPPYIAPRYRDPAINAWIARRGGLPPDGIVAWMRYADASSVFRPC